jgi:hypothetical protein
MKRNDSPSREVSRKRFGLARLARPALCAATMAGLGLLWNPSYAVPQKSQAQPQIFTPHCAARPRCIANVCVRSGRCKLGNQAQVTGCLLYACRSAPR